MIYRDRKTPVDSKTLYGVTEKEPLDGVATGTDERASIVVRDLIKNEWGMEPVSIPKIFRELLGKSPYSLSYYEVSEMVKNAKNLGYLEAVRLRN